MLQPSCPKVSSRKIFDLTYVRALAHKLLRTVLAADISTRTLSIPTYADRLRNCEKCQLRDDPKTENGFKETQKLLETFLEQP